WMALHPQERLALLGHEVAHGVNGDVIRGFLVGSALRALDEWIGFFRAPLQQAAPAVVTTRERMGSSEHLDDVLLRNAYSTAQSGATILGLFRQRIAELPDREWQRLARSGQRERARIDASHPPTAYRIGFLGAHVVTKPRMIAAENVMRTIDVELCALQETLGRRLIARYACD